MTRSKTLSVRPAVHFFALQLSDEHAYIKPIAIVCSLCSALVLLHPLQACKWFVCLKAFSRSVSCFHKRQCFS